MLKSELKEVLQ